MSLDNWKTAVISIAIFLVVAMLIFGTSWMYEKVTFNHYEDGFQDGVQNTILVINQNIEKQGFIKITAGDQFMILAPVRLEQSE